MIVRSIAEAVLFFVIYPGYQWRKNDEETQEQIRHTYSAEP